MIKFGSKSADAGGPKSVVKMDDLGTYSHSPGGSTVQCKCQ